MPGLNLITTQFRTQFQDEFRMDFERTQSILRKTVSSIGTVAGSEIRWDVVDPSDAAHERGRDGAIPVSQLGLSQVSATVREHFKKYSIDDFDLLRANPNTRTAMYKRGISAVNKAIDQIITDSLDATTVEVSGSGAALSTQAAVDDWVTRLWSNDIMPDGNVWGLITPRAFAQMKRIATFTSADFVTEQIMVNGVPNPMTYIGWLGVKWVMFNGLTGAGTNNARCYIYHGDAIGHAIKGEPEAHPYYYEPQDRYETWVKAIHASRVVLPRGVVRFRHDDTAALS